MTPLPQSIQNLSTAEKLGLVQAVWDDIAQTSEFSAATNEIHVELFRRAAWNQANPDHGQTLDEIVLKLGVRL